MKNFLYFICLISSSIFSSVEAEELNLQQVGKIYPSQQVINIKTQEGFVYTHYEGKNPSWQSELLKHIEFKGAPVTGNGSLQTFTVSTRSPYHLVEETTAKGSVFLSLRGDIQKPFQYIIRKGDINIKQGYISNQQLQNIPPIYLPHGNYTLQAIAVGYSTSQPIEISLSPTNQEQFIPIHLQINKVRLIVNTTPKGVAEGHTAILRQIDPKQQFVLTEKIIPINTPIELPTGQYTIEMPTIDEYDRPGNKGILGRYDITLDNSPFNLIAKYTSIYGQLTISLTSELQAQELEAIKIVLESSKTQEVVEPVTSEIDLTKNERKIFYDRIHEGSYLIKFISKDMYTQLKIPENQTISIDKGSREYLSKKLSINYGSLKVTTNFDYLSREAKMLPTITLKSNEGKIISEDKGSLAVNNLIPGIYNVSFSSIDTYTPPEPMQILIRPGSKLGPIEGLYQLNKEFFVLTYDTGPKKERLDKIRFWITDSNGVRKMYPQGTNYIQRDSQRTVIIKDLTPGKYSIEFLIPNSDDLFEIPPPKTFVKTRELLTLNQSFKPRFGSIKAKIDTSLLEKEYTQLPMLKLFDHTHKIIAQTEESQLTVKHLQPGTYHLRFGKIEEAVTPKEVEIKLSPEEHLGPIVGVYKEMKTPFTLTTNKEDITWELFQGDKIILREKGTQANLQVPDGDNYHLKTSSLQGHKVYVHPQENFTLQKNKAFEASIYYKPVYGGISFSSQLEYGDQIMLALIPKDGGGEVIEAIIPQVGGNLYWESPNVLIGDYELQYILPDGYQAILPENIHIVENQVLDIRPILEGSRSCTINTQVDTAVFTLSKDDTVIQEGKGKSFTFKKLFPGEYTLSFAPLLEEKLIAPRPFKIIVSPIRDSIFNIRYIPASHLIVSSNIPNFRVQITNLDSQETFLHTIEDLSHDFMLPLGMYRVEFLPIDDERYVRYSNNYPEPTEIILSANASERIQGIYEANKGSLVITSNLVRAAYHVYDITSGEPLEIGVFRGKHMVIPFTFAGTYRIIFETIPGYETPKPIEIEIFEGQRVITGGEYISQERIVNVPKGPCIVGDIFGDGSDDEHPFRTIELDAFSIGAYPVSNQQYAKWLTQASSRGLIKYSNKPGLEGLVKDQQGHLLCETYEADSNSQLTVERYRDHWEIYPT